jgi:hypothetical protein
MAPSGHITHADEAMHPLSENDFGGLTKREYFAVHLMAALIAREPYKEDGLLRVARTAVTAAEALAAELNR